MSVCLNKQDVMYVVDYTDMDGENLRTMLVLARNKTIALEKVAEYVGIPCKCVGCSIVSSGMYLVS